MSPLTIPAEPNPSPSRKRSFWLYVPPPPLFIATFIIGLQIDHVLGWAIVPSPFEPGTRALGALAVACALALVIAAALLFFRKRTTIIPHATSSSLVTSGPYRVSRNPMYLALALGQMGCSLLTNLAWPLLLVALPLWLMNAKVIPAEEQSLVAVFGDEYRSYQTLVGRWF